MKQISMKNTDVELALIYKKLEQIILMKYTANVNVANQLFLNV